MYLHRFSDIENNGLVDMYVYHGRKASNTARMDMYTTASAFLRFSDALMVAITYYLLTYLPCLLATLTILYANSSMVRLMTIIIPYHTLEFSWVSAAEAVAFRSAAPRLREGHGVPD